MNKKANHSAVILSVIALFALGGIAIINSGATGAVSTALPCTTAADCPNGQACIEGFCQVFERAGPISEGVEFTAVPLGNPSQATIRIQRIQNLRASADSYFMPRATVQMIITTSGQTILGHSNGPLELIDPLKNSENWEFNFKLIDDTIVSLSIPNPALFGELNANENGFRVQTDSAHYSMLTDAAAQIRSLCAACEVTTNPAALNLNVRYSSQATEFGFSVPRVGPPATVTVDKNPNRQLNCGERTTITATVKDSAGQNVADHTPVILDDNPLVGSFIPNPAETLSGIAMSEYTAPSTPFVGIVRITATADSVSGFTDVDVQCV